MVSTMDVATMALLVKSKGKAAILISDWWVYLP